VIVVGTVKMCINLKKYYRLHYIGFFDISQHYIWCFLKIFSVDKPSRFVHIFLKKRARIKKERVLRAG
jgi:hypothetical protein